MNKMAVQKMKIVLTVSLLLNVFMISVFAGKHFQDRSGYDRVFEREEVSQDTRLVIRSAFKEKKDDIRAIMKETHEKSAALEDIISAPDFDVDAYNRAAFSLQELGARVSMHRLSTFREILSGLSQEERAKVAKLVTSKIMSKKHHKKKRSKDGERKEKRDNVTD